MAKLLYTIAFLLVLSGNLWAQQPQGERPPRERDERSNSQDEGVITGGEVVVLANDSIWKPNPRKATMLSAAFPGAGQIYNRQWWKAPVIYAGLGVLGYFVHVNHGYYTDYRNAYIDFVDGDPTTNRYMDLDALKKGYEITNDDYFESLLENQKDYYRRNRDLLVFSMIGVYVLNILEANVAAHLYDFDVSDDLSLNLSPHINYDIFQRSPSLGFSVTLSINK